MVDLPKKYLKYLKCLKYLKYLELVLIAKLVIEEKYFRHSKL